MFCAIRAPTAATSTDGPAAPSAVRVASVTSPPYVPAHLLSTAAPPRRFTSGPRASEVVAAFAAFARDSGVRLTFFPNGCYRSWTDNAPVLRPLIDAGQVALGNHTWTHPDLTTLGDAEVAEEITRNQQFLRTTFGVRDTPFLRPPYGARDDRIDRIAANLRHPTIALWNGPLDDSRLLSAQELLAAARQWFTAQTIVV